MMEKDLPEGWIEVKIEELTTVVAGGTPSTTKSEYFDGDIPWISPVDLSGYNEKYISKGRRNISELGLKNSSARLLPKGTVLFSSRAPIGYVAIAENELCTNQGFKSLLPNESFDSSYAYYYLKFIREFAESQASGTTFKELSGSKMGQLPFLLPPLAEQKRIVAKLDAAFGLLDRMKERLARIPELLKTFRQAVLTQAVTGKLTGATEFTTLGEMGVNIQTGPFGSALHQKDYVEGGVPVINPSHIKNGEILPDFSVSVNEEKLVELKAWILEDNDVILGRRGEMGRAALYRKDFGPMLCGTGSLVLKYSTELSSEFLVYFLRSPFCINFLTANSVGSTMINLNQKIIKSLPFPSTTLEEQQEIVRRVEALLAKADALEAQYLLLKEKIDRLPQALLAQAFRGELVEQDPSDEPAEKLLEKIAYTKKKSLSQKQKKVSKKYKGTAMKRDLMIIIKDHFNGELFSFDQLLEKSQLRYEEISSELLSHVSSDNNSKELSMHFNVEKNCIEFKIRKT